MADILLQTRVCEYQHKSSTETESERLFVYLSKPLPFIYVVTINSG